MSDKAAEEPGTSRSGSFLTCEECGKVCRSVRGLLQHKQIHSPDYVDTRRPKGSATTLHYKKKVPRKPDQQQESEPNKKVTVVVEDASPDDVVTGGLVSSEGLKKVTVLVEVGTHFNCYFFTLNHDTRKKKFSCQNEYLS
ncbi:Paternally-expressed gene 3 protein [Frankliniella fusca]|uniref:Paternally-expressed gene 3 protein n=1 Tax=Frankliniella fusca TaxID=407009 RepID=A0AAE1LJ66_9NEOP|nr:Paternally-expressed gene 3 protein [Frankliniella fusca]